MAPFADYTEERELFQGLLAPDCRKRILFFRGASGTGKTTLLTHCQSELKDRQDFIHVPIQLRASVVSVPEIFYRLAGRVGWKNLPQFSGQVASQQPLTGLTLEDIRIEGTQNQIQIALHTEDYSERSTLLAALTERCFADLEARESALLLLLDTYEAATSEVKDWIAGPLLGRVAAGKHVRVLVAGQEVPDDNNIEWGAYSQTRDLFGVSDASHWMPVVAALNRRIEAPDPLSWLAGICHAFNGRPASIIQVIKALPLKGAAG